MLRRISLFPRSCCSLPVKTLSATTSAFASSTRFASSSSKFSAGSVSSTSKKTAFQQTPSSSSPSSTKEPSKKVLVRLQQQQEQEPTTKKQSTKVVEEQNTSSSTKLSFWEKWQKYRTEMTVKKMVLEHGPLFGTWYLILNTIVHLILTTMLHFGLFGGFVESRELAVKFGVGDRFDYYAGRTRHIVGDIHLSGRFAANYIVVSTILGPFIPIKVAYSLAAYPYFLRVVPAALKQSAK